MSANKAQRRAAGRFWAELLQAQHDRFCVGDTPAARRSRVRLERVLLQSPSLARRVRISWKLGEGKKMKSIKPTLHDFVVSILFSLFVIGAPLLMMIGALFLER